MKKEIDLEELIYALSVLEKAHYEYGSTTYDEITGVEYVDFYIISEARKALEMSDKSAYKERLCEELKQSIENGTIKIEKGNESLFKIINCLD